MFFGARGRDCRSHAFSWTAVLPCIYIWLFASMGGLAVKGGYMLRATTHCQSPRQPSALDCRSCLSRMSAPSPSTRKYSSAMSFCHPPPVSSISSFWFSSPGQQLRHTGRPDGRPDRPGRRYGTAAKGKARCPCPAGDGLGFALIGSATFLVMLAVLDLLFVAVLRGQPAPASPPSTPTSLTVAPMP